MLKHLIAIACLCIPLHVAAQETGCEAEVTQRDLNDCAVMRFTIADKTLNETYAAARTEIRRRNAGAPDPNGEQLLRKAQPLWIQFRDAACAAETHPYDGGSSRSMMESDCRTRLTQRRTEDLIRQAQPM